MQPPEDAARPDAALGGVQVAADLPDLVVPVREGAYTEHLRYALRSWAANVEHRNVWVIGYRPWWVVNVRHIETYQRDTPGYVNTTTAMRAACEHPEISDPFIWCNDDMFIMKPQPHPFPVYHRGPVREVLARAGDRLSSYMVQMARTRDFLVELGYEDPVCYELHIPRVTHKAGMLKALHTAPGYDAHKLTVFYSMAGVVGGTQMADVKIQHRRPQGYGPDSEFLSTMPDAFANGHVGKFIRAAFPERCRYEKRGR